MFRSGFRAAWTLGALLCLGAVAGAQEASKLDDLDRLLDEAAPKVDEPAKPGEVSSDDKSIDDLLGKYAESDAPETKDERRPMPPPGDQPPLPPGGDQKPDNLDPGARDIDKHLEEMIRTRRNKQQGDPESGMLAEAIKQMRQVQKKLEETDTGEKTQEEQQEVVKKLEQALEQARKMASSGGRMRMQRMAGQPQQPGQEQQQPSQTTDPKRGVDKMNPGDVKRGALADGKDEWGHLPPELRQEMTNVFREKLLESRRALIEKYYLSVARKGRGAGQ